MSEHTLQFPNGGQCADNLYRYTTRQGFPSVNRASLTKVSHFGFPNRSAGEAKWQRATGHRTGHSFVNFCGSTSAARLQTRRKNSQTKIRMAAIVEEGTAPKLGSGKCGGSTSATNSRVRWDVTAGETANFISPTGHRKAE